MAQFDETPTQSITLFLSLLELQSVIHEAPIAEFVWIDEEYDFMAVIVATAEGDWAWSDAISIDLEDLRVLWTWSSQTRDIHIVGVGRNPRVIGSSSIDEVVLVR